jgi:hypothetical protein
MAAVSLELCLDSVGRFYNPLIIPDKGQNVKQVWGFKLLVSEKVGTMQMCQAAKG